MKRKALLLLCAAALLLLSACGAVDGAEGEYLCVALSVDGGSFSPEYLFDTPPRLILSAGGRGRLSAGGETGVVRWSREGESLQVSAVERNLTGSLVDGVAELRLSDSGVLVTFVREDLVDSYSADPAGALAARWGGDWYGWWEISDSAGAMPNTWYDCFATVEVLTDGSARMLLWDEQSGREEPMGLVLLRLEEDRAVVMGGRFWLQELGDNAWTLALGATPFVNMAVMSGAVHDSEGERFTYSLCLRPWGQEWEDVRAAGERLPYYYDNWAQPLMQQGASMPDSIQMGG